MAGKHHGIYLSDPRGAAPERMKTVLRQPIRGLSVMEEACVHVRAAPRQFCHNEVGPEGWARLTQAVQGTVHLPAQVPDFALAPPDPEHPVTIHLSVQMGVGGVDIYRL